ncbi:ribosomal protein L23 [Colletotrichum plurivorum]|uniref:Large ribosomal subunit protein uL23m n=1 Tax=Colletotrichum plurivorum TaxID=2175906 RepID=A0A8H6NT61_9PEZI|nr:ribosomal protein L23 [Colletotrichum plurivorum]
MVRTLIKNTSGPSFKLGRKRVFFPEHVITFIRTDKQPPNWATFHVPLRWNKFDLRDYLWNLYGVDSVNVRSWLKQKPVTRKGSGAGSYYRPLPDKYMTAELTTPFVWPEPPSDLEPWSNQLWETREEIREQQETMQTERSRGNLPYPSKQPMDAQRRFLRDEAEALLKGEKKWEGHVQLDSKWDYLVKDAKAAKAAREAEEKAKEEARKAEAKAAKEKSTR